MHPAQMEELVRRLVADPNDQHALQTAYGQGQADPRAYASLLERVGDLTQDTTFAAHWLSEAANVWSSALGDARRAATLLMRAIEKDPASDVASDRLAALYREKGDHRALVALYERRAKALAQIAAHDPALTQRLSILHEDLGRLWQDPPLSQPRKALENYKKAFEVDPGAVTAIYAARELLKAQGDVKEAYPLYELEIRAIDDQERKIALLRDEAALRQANSDAKGGTNALRSALRLVPDDMGLQYELATSIVSRILAGDTVPESERKEAADLLVEMAQQYDGDHALAYSESALDAMPGHDRAMQLVDHFAKQVGRDDLEARWAAYVDANPKGAMVSEARTNLAKTYETSGRLEDAIKMLKPLENDPNPSVAIKLGDLYAKAGKTNELAAHMDRHSAQLPPAERVAKQIEIAMMLAGKGDKKGALGKYRDVLETDPQHPEALAYVEDALRATRQYKELRDVLLSAARAANAPLDSRKSQLREAASLSESQLKDADGAVNAHRQLLALDRNDESSRAALHRLLEKGQRWDDLAALVEQEAMAAADVEQQIALEKKLADLHEKKRGDKREAAEALLRVVTHAPKDEDALARAVDLLCAIDDFQRAAAALDEYVGALDAGPQKGKLLTKLGELRDRLGDQNGAADAYAEAGEILHDGDVWRRAEDCATKVERWEQAATAAARRGDLERDPGKQALLRATEAEYILRSGDPQTAIARLEQAIDLAPRDENLADKLERMYEQEGRLDDLAGYLVRRAEGTTDQEQSLALLRRAAVFRRERLTDPDGARDLLLRIVGSTEDRDALSQLAEDASTRDDHASALKYLARLEALATDRAEKTKIALRQAQITADGIGDVDGAIERYKVILDTLNENCREALQAIADLEQARDRYPQAADALERDLELASAGEEKANIARRLGEIYIDHTRELGKSLAAYETVVREDPEDFAALHKLRELSERAEKWPRVLELLDQQIEVEGDDDEIASLTARKAEVLADHTGQVDEALRTLAPFTAGGSDVARAAALAIADRHKADAQIGGQILAWARTTGGTDGQRLLGEAFDRFVAGKAFDRALEIIPDVLRTPRGKDPAFLEQAEKLAVDARSTELALEVQDRRIGGLSGMPRGEELVRQARVRIDLGIPRIEALEHGEIGLGAVPPGEATVLMNALSELAPTPLAAVELYERQITRCKTPGDKLAAIVRAYRKSIELEATGGAQVADKTRELVELALGLAAAPEDAFDSLYAAASPLDAVSDESQHRRRLIEILVASTVGPRDGGRTRSAQLRRAADRMGRELGDDQRALELLAQGLVAHVDAATLDAIEQATEDDPSRAETIYTKALEEVFDGPLVRQIIGRRATLRKDRLGDLDGALRDLKKLHELAPADQAITDRYRAVLTEANDYRGLIQLCEDQILRSKDQGVRADLARQIAHIWEGRLGEAREAADAWRRVLRLKPQDPEATAGLDRAKRNKLEFDPDKHPAQRVLVETSIAPPPPGSRPPAARASARPMARPLAGTPSVRPPSRPSTPPRSEPQPAPTPRSDPPITAPSADETDELVGDLSSQTMTAAPKIAAASELTMPEDYIDTSVGPLGAPREIPEATAEIPFHAATDAFAALPSITDDEDEDEDMKTLVGDSQAIAARDAVEARRDRDRSRLRERSPAETDEIPALQLPHVAHGANPDASAEFVADDEVEIVDDDELVVEDDDHK